LSVSIARRITLKLEVKPKTPAGWLRKGKAVASAANAEPATFSSITGLLGQLTTDVEKLDAAEAAAGNRGKKEIADRNAAVVDLQKSLRAFVAGVQGLCDQAPDAEHAAAIAKAASLAIKKVPVQHKADLAAKALGAGTVRVVARVPVKRGRRVYYEWAMSSDGGETWLSLPGTNYANTLVHALTPGTKVAFRYRTTVKNVVSDWSQVVSVQVL
jgi:hypothetical protein